MHDLLKAPIQQLKYEVRRGRTILAQGVTDAEGKLAKVQGKIGDELTVHVQRIENTNEMKLIKTFQLTAPVLLLPLVSGKVLFHFNAIKHEGEKGTYKKSTYTVKSGDTLSKIAHAHNTTVDELTRVNHISHSDINHLEVGQVFTLPAPSAQQEHADAHPSTPEHHHHRRHRHHHHPAHAPLQQQRSASTGNPTIVVPPIAGQLPTQITVDQLQQIFSDANTEFLQQVCDELNPNLVRYKLDTRLRKAHFFAQIYGETNTSMRPVTESWEYSPAALISFSSYYRSNPEEAHQDGYLKDSHQRIIRHCDQQAVGRKHFERLNGNRQDHPEDGYNLRGRGLIQITGYDKYNGFMVAYSSLWTGAVPDTVNHPDLVNQMPYAVRSAVWFWMRLHTLYLIADTGSTNQVVDRISHIVNGGAMGQDARRTGFSLAIGAFN
jgi:predicted chitinase/LysM repeat protein